MASVYESKRVTVSFANISRFREVLRRLFFLALQCKYHEAKDVAALVATAGFSSPAL